MLEIQSGYAAVALDIQQQLDAFRGWAVVDGLHVEPSGAGDLRVIANRGTALCGGTRNPLVEEALAIEPPNPDNPRRDVIYVDEQFDLRVESGLPNPIRPDEDGATPEPFECWSPWPPSMHDIEGTVLAEVWVGPGQTEITLDHIRNRQISADKAVNFLKAQSASVSQVPQNPEDVVRLQDLQGGGSDDGSLLTDLDANGFNITNAGSIDAQTMRIATMDPGLDAVVNRAEIQKYYRRSGDTLTGAMNANDQDIQNAGEIDGDIVEAGEEFYLPVYTGSDPENGHMWIRRDLE